MSSFPRPTPADRPLRVEQLEDRLTPAVTFRFDYTYDTSGFFADPARRAALERAAADLTARIDSTPSALASTGTNSWRAVFNDPTTGAQVVRGDLVVPAGVLVVFPGAAHLGGAEAGEGGPGGFQATGSRDFLQAVSTRGVGGVAAWGGSVTFDPDKDWYFGADPAGLGRNQVDFYSIATHELGHVLGFGSGQAFADLVRSGAFTGAAATAVYGSAPPVSGDHWAQGIRVGGQPVSMQPVAEPDRRVGFSQLDYAALADLGWQVSGLPTAADGTPIGAASTVVSGPDGAVQLYVAGADGRLAPSGAVFHPFPDFTGPVRAVTADVNGDGVDDLIVGTGPGGGSRIRVLDGRTRQDLVPEFAAFERSYVGGVYLAAGDFDGDGRAEVVVTPDEGGGARVKILALGPGGLQTVADFFGIDDPNFRGGARSAVGDVNGDGVPDLVVSAGFGGGPRVSVLDGSSVLGGDRRPLVADFFAFEEGLRNGSYVSVGDVDGDGFADLVLGAGPGGAPRVLTLSGKALVSGGPAAALAGPLGDLFAGDTTDRGGVRVTAKDLDGDGRADVVTGSGDGGQVQVYKTAATGGLVSQASLTAFAGTNRDGVYVG